MQTFDVYENDSALMLVMEHCEISSGPIWWKNMAEGQYSEEEAARLIHKILSIIRYMHDHQVVHGDCKYMIELLYIGSTVYWFCLP